MQSLLRRTSASAARPPWTPGPSSCLALPGFEPVDLYPIRSPLLVADFLAPRVAGATLCEIGTRNGDVLACLAHHARRVLSVEMAPEYCTKLRARGLEVLCTDFELLPPLDMPAADVYYWWPADAAGQNELWLTLIARALRLQSRRADVYIGYDLHWPPDMANLPVLAQRYNATVERLFFDEGGQLRGREPHRAPNQLSRQAEFEASMTRRFYDRPGHWGVFLLLKFEVGPALWEAIDRHNMQHPRLTHFRRNSPRGHWTRLANITAAGVSARAPHHRRSGGAKDYADAHKNRHYSEARGRRPPRPGRDAAD